MSDPETDTDLAVSQYDAEDDLNYYGSPVSRSVDNELDTALDTAPATSNRTQVSFPVLCCS